MTSSSEKISRGLNKTCIFLIVISGMENFAYKGIASNLVTYLTDVMKMSNSAAAKTVSSWCGFTAMVPLLIAPLIDSYCTRYSAILVFCFVYASGLLALASTTLRLPWIPPKETSSFSSLMWSLCMISLGQGGYKPSLQAFGADQIEEDNHELPLSKSTDKDSPQKSTFFHWLYYGICTGAFLGITVMSYVQDEYGWGLGFAIPSFSMVASLVLFSCGTRFYTYKQTKNVHHRTNWSFDRLVQTVKGIVSRISKCQITFPNSNSVVELELEEKPLFNQENGQESTDDGTATAKENFLIEIARVSIRLLPIWTSLLMFAVIFQQPSTFFVKQGMKMRRNIGPNFKIPPATLQSAISISIISLMPVYDSLFIPFINLFTRNDKGITVIQRMGVGMFLSIIAMILAALVETKRLQLSSKMPAKEDNLSIYWMLPQYIILGIADIFTIVGMQEFFYTEVPIHMRTIGIAFQTSVFGAGSFSSALLISTVEYFSSYRGNPSWFSEDTSNARLDLYYWLLAFLCALSTVMFIVSCRFFKTRI